MPSALLVLMRVKSYDIWCYVQVQNIGQTPSPNRSYCQCQTLSTKKKTMEIEINRCFMTLHCLIETMTNQLLPFVNRSYHSGVSLFRLARMVVWVKESRFVLFFYEMIHFQCLIHLNSVIRSKHFRSHAFLLLKYKMVFFTFKIHASKRKNKKKTEKPIENL